MTEILLILSQAAYSFFWVCAYLVFLHSFYDTGFLWSKRKAVILAVFLLVIYTLMVYLPFGDYLIGPYYILLFLIALYDYRGKKLKGLLRFTATTAVEGICFGLISVIAAFILMSDAQLNDPEAAIPNEFVIGLSLFSTLFYAGVFFYLYYKLYKPGIVVRCGIREFIFLLIYPSAVFALLMVIAIARSLNLTVLLMLILTGLSILCALMFPVFVYYARISRHYQKRTAFQESFMQLELAHFRQYMHTQEETRRFRHDIRNNLLCMNEMVAAGNREKLEQYLKDLLEITDSLSFRYVSGDELLDSILNSKAQTMEQQGISFTLDGVLAGGLPWKAADICAVFANALDNAMEACAYVAPKNRHISMRIKSTPQFWLITIENSVAEAVDTKKLFQKNGGYTSKSDTSMHGIGTYSMKQTVESYGAILNANCTADTFTLEIIVDKSQP